METDAALLQLCFATSIRTLLVCPGNTIDGGRMLPRVAIADGLLDTLMPAPDALCVTSG